MVTLNGDVLDFDRLMSELDELDPPRPFRFPSLRAMYNGHRKMFAMLGVLVLAAAVVAAVFSVQQFLHSPNSTAPEQFILKNCDNAASSVPSVQQGSNGLIVWNCAGTPATAAITINVASGSHTATVSWSHDPTFTSLFIYKPGVAGPTGACSTGGAAKDIGGAGTGGNVVLTSADNGDWNYCSDFANYPATTPTDTSVTWSG
jgi:hypothetical protein